MTYTLARELSPLHVGECPTPGDTPALRLCHPSTGCPVAGELAFRADALESPSSSDGKVTRALGASVYSPIKWE